MIFAEDDLNRINVVQMNFCIWDSFPSAYSGKRDISFIKNKVENLIEIKLDNQQ